MRSLFPLVRLWKLALYRWALKEIHPLHPDVPYLVHELHRWEKAK